MKSIRHETRYLQLVLLALVAIGLSFYFLTGRGGGTSSTYTQQLENRLATLEHKNQELEQLLRKFNITSPLLSSSSASSSSPSASAPTSSTSTSSSTPSNDKENVCFKWEKEWEVNVGVSWGKATKAQQALWRASHCDRVIQVPLAPPLLSPMPTDYDYSPSANKIAICLGVTTRKIVNPSFEKLSLFKAFFPSLETHLESGFVYWVYVGYDVGDQFFDRPGQESRVMKWFDDLFAARRKQGMNITLHLKKLENAVPKPGPVFNAVLKQAYDDGADFFYRVNDDSVFLTQWATALRNFVIGFGPPYGAVGPWCSQGNGGILTHDFVHKTHMEIFDGVYYPPIFSDWYMDDWITRVYGRKRTRRLQSVRVEHRVSAHGQRYTVDYSHGSHLTEELAKGREKIAQWMQTHNISPTVIATFRNDSTTFSVGEGR